MAPGYTGRKRGEAVRTRTVVQQSHTHELLGSFGNAGNGDRLAELQQGCECVALYMNQCGNGARALARFDGAYGRPRDVLLIQQPRHGVRLHFVTRATTRSVLKHPRVVALLKELAHDRFYQADTGTDREVFDVGFIDWATKGKPNEIARVRMIVTRRTLTHKDRVSVGYRVGARLFELFATDLEAEGFTACDVLDLYFSRGGFERTLSQEDQELASDRWVSGNPYGQELWQIMCQWVWNKRIALAFKQAPTPLRTTLFREAIVSTISSDTIVENAPDSSSTTPKLEAATVDSSDEPVATPTSEMPSEPVATPNSELPSEPVATPNSELPSEPVATPASELPSDEPVATPASELPSDEPVATPAPSGRASGRAITIDPLHIDPMALQHIGRSGFFGAVDFCLLPDGTLSCPADKLLRPTERLHQAANDAVRFAAKVTDCQSCEKLGLCMPVRPSGASGRRLTLRLLAPCSPTSPTKVNASPSKGAGSKPSGPCALPEPTSLEPKSLQPPVPGCFPIIWQDLPSACMRRGFMERLRDRRVDVVLAPTVPYVAPSIVSRDMRAHRRLTWQARFARNARCASSTPTASYRVHAQSPPAAQVAPA